MDVRILQHAEGEWIAAMEPWFRQRQATLTTCRPDLGDALPEELPDWLLIMGGPMSVNDEAACPWLAAERAYIRKAIDKGCIVLGICLGGQLIAKALGAGVYPNSEQEIGWHPVTRTDASADWLPTKFSPLHWHGECFSLPEGARPLCRSEITPLQGFTYGDRVVALQFHLEADTATADCFYKLEQQTLPSTRFVQTPEEMRNNSTAVAESRKVLYSLLNALNAP
ncbi:type 1 glutamine amidotransferase [Granulosicoccaceae sp. 1_MG-2023]|nr:type 1 glutamine amidotransferase [Granulosicoccaceae sp. 1_MG-2023]